MTEEDYPYKGSVCSCFKDVPVLKDPYFTTRCPVEKPLQAIPKNQPFSDITHGSVQPDV